MKKSIFLIFMFLWWAHSYAQDNYSQQNNERLFNTGSQLIQRKEFAAARITFEDFLSKADKSDLRKIEAEYFIALSALNLYHQDAEKLVQGFIDGHPNHPRAGSIYFDMADFFYAEKNYARAIDYFSKAEFSSLNKDQAHAGKFKWGYSLFNLKKFPEALSQFNVAKIQGNQFGPAANYYAGYIEFNSGDYENALTDLKRAGENESYASLVPPLLASVYYKQKKYDLLLDYVNSLKKTSESSLAPELLLLVAESNFKKEDYKKSYEAFKGYLNAKPTLDKGVLARAGFAALSTGNDNEALEYLRSAASNKDSVGYYASYYLGYLYLKKQQKPLALNAFDIARKFASDKRISEESQYQFSKIALDLGRGDIAIEALESYLKSYPLSNHSAEVKELLSQAYLTSNNYDRAITYIESFDTKGEMLNRVYQKATFLKGVEFFNKENYDQAEGFFSKSIILPVDNTYKAEALYWLGEIASMNKKFSEAIGDYKDALELLNGGKNDIEVKSKYGLGYAYFNQQQWANAILNFKDFISKTTPQNPNYGDAVIRLADCYYVTKQYQDALTNYGIVTKNPNSVDKDYAFLQAGNIYSILDKYSNAMAEFDKIIKDFPNSRYIDEAMYQRAQLDFEQGNYSQAVKSFSRLIESGRPSKFLPLAYMRRAASFYNLKMFDKTASDYITILEKYPSHPVANDALLPLQEALTSSGRPEDFDRYLAQFKISNPTSKGIESVEYEAAKALYFNQDYSKAIASLSNFIAAYPQGSRIDEATYYRAESYFRLKDFKKALDAYYELSTLDNFTLSNKVISRIAELEFKNGNLTKALSAFWKLKKIATTKKEQYSAWSGLMESYYALKNYDSVAHYAQAILDFAKVNAGAENKATLFIGKASYAKGNYELAKDEFLITLNNAQDESGAEAKYLLGELQFKLKEYKQCYETLVSLNRDFSTYPLWKGKSYLLLSDYYLAKDDRFNSKATLQSLIDNSPLQSIKDAAKEKLKALEETDAAKQSQDSTLIKDN